MPDKPKGTNGQQPDSSFIQLDDAKQKGAASAASAPRRKAMLGALTAVCIALIVVSLGFVHPSESGAWSIDWIVQTMTGESVVANDAKVPGSAAASSKADSKNSKVSGDAKDKSKDSGDAKGDSESSNKSSDKKLGRQKVRRAGWQEVWRSIGFSEYRSCRYDQHVWRCLFGRWPVVWRATASNGGGASTGGQGGSQESGYVTVSVSVASSAVGNPVSAGGTYTFNEGATVYDALCALGLSVNAHGSSYGTYVAAIGGLAEKQYGGTSGWMYSVNGSTPMTACSNYVLSNGDNVVWYYVTG